MRIGAISPSGEQLAPARRLVMHWIRSQGNGQPFCWGGRQNWWIHATKTSFE
jgi:hypothetical protein